MKLHFLEIQTYQLNNDYNDSITSVQNKKYFQTFIMLLMGIDVSKIV